MEIEDGDENEPIIEEGVLIGDEPLILENEINLLNWYPYRNQGDFSTHPPLHDPFDEDELSDEDILNYRFWMMEKILEIEWI